jgi:SpoIID/LytB domain protein
MGDSLISVGILSAPSVYLDLHGEFAVGVGSDSANGRCHAFLSDAGIILEAGDRRFQTGAVLELHPKNPDTSSFTLHDVTIGVRFHWERLEDQRFPGSIRLVRSGRVIVVINVVAVEDYLKSVIASEMSATSPGEFLKAQAITSRSWLLARLEATRRRKSSGAAPSARSFEDDSRRIRWYDAEDHELFDVCADDHCQRYHGLSNVTAPAAANAVNATRGTVLMHEGEICDARFSKCCGGVTEAFENVWEPSRHEYLTNIADRDGFDIVDLRAEAAASAFIVRRPDVYCNTADREILRQVLPDFDQETRDFFRWRTAYTQDEISRIICEKSGIEFGKIVDLVPIERGFSGRIVLLNIIGTEKELAIGKELEIRRTLSPSHLYSSAFVVERSEFDGRTPGRFTLRGAGWGHGVGLCQIGAAVMGARGKNAEAILQHYFPGTSIAQQG